MNSISGKKILLVVPNFHGYETEIINEIIAQGATLYYITHSGFKKTWQSKESDRLDYLKNLRGKIIDAINQKCFDFFLVINTGFVDAEILHLFKQKNPAATSIIYLWDSLINLGSFQSGDLLNNYDRRYSFDYADCKNYPQFQLKHRPTFYHPYGSTLKPPSKHDFDIASVMSANPDRLKFINRLEKSNPRLLVKCSVYLPSLLSIPAFLINHSVFFKPRHMFRKRVTIFQALNMLNKSNCILDITFHNQNGLTLRSHDALSMNKKLITTNQEIVRYDFYDKANIFVIPPGKMEDIGEFLKTPMNPVSEEIKNKYSVSFWVKSILLNLDLIYAQ